MFDAVLQNEERKYGNGNRKAATKPQRKFEKIIGKKSNDTCRKKSDVEC